MVRVNVDVQIQKPAQCNRDFVNLIDRRSFRIGGNEICHDFANDTDVNLLASQGKANQSKSDQGLDTWLPPNAAFQCDYAIRYLTVAVKYHLMITAADAGAARSACAQK
ncbi:hypothetical protein [Rhodococcus qingshengii]|uniref:hypothetical protein n=1 Tax=Rhodococcus qingshengii TaxID=334542 RepID=UPI00210CBE1C|nr:hypothetical protein [Rhodococcus qingshengii]MCQ4150557.1 hypothetical protein [Rhodococcus qingshengii]